MKISSIIKAVLAPQSGRSDRPLAALKPGDHLVGQVLKQENDGRVLIDLGARRVLAQIGFPVKTGQHLNLQVMETGPLLHLRADTSQNEMKPSNPLPGSDFTQVLNAKDQTKFIGITGRLIDASHQHGTQNILPKAIQNALVQIRTLYESVPLEKSLDQISRWLKSAVEHRGLLFEKQLADIVGQPLPIPSDSDPINLNVPQDRIVITRDIKSQLLQVKQYFSQDRGPDSVTDKIDHKELSFFRRSVDRLLGHIDQQQDRAVARWHDGENHQMFVHTLSLPDENKNLRLKMYYPRKDRNNGDDRPHRIALLLDMNNLGDVRVDLSMIGLHLNIGIFVVNEDAQHLLMQQIKTLETPLSGLFEKISINVSVSKTKVAQFEREDINPGGEGKININV